MAINDIDHVFHVIYEKFAENQKDKKYEERVYIGEDEFIHDLKEFVKKSEVEDKGLLISEIYRSVSEDALEISSDGKITVSPKVLRKVENKILERKERDEQINARNELQGNENNNFDISKISINDLTYQQYINLSEEEKTQLFVKSVKKLTESLGVEITEQQLSDFSASIEKENVLTDPQTLKEKEKEQMERMFKDDDNSQITSNTKEALQEAYEKVAEILEGSFGKAFIYNGKLDRAFFNKMAQELETNDCQNIRWMINKTCQFCEYDDERRLSILRALNGMTSDDLKKQMVKYIAMDRVIKELEPMYADMKDLSIDEAKRKVDDLLKLTVAIREDDLKTVCSELNSLQSENTRSQPAVENIDRIDEEIEEVFVHSGLDEKVNDEIEDFELGILFDMAEEMQVEPLEEPVVEDETVDLESSSAPEVIAENNSAIHAETIDVAQPEEKVVQQVEEQAVEENSRKDIESNLPKELTWVDRAKQGLFKVGKTISNVIKAVTDKNSSKGLFERIADAINSDNNSASDSSSSSGTSSSAGPSVDEKPIQAPVDYLNTQFKVDVKLAAETAKAASEKQAQRRDASSELTQDEEQL